MAEVDVTRIAGNIGALNSLYSLANINKQLSTHQTRLATGKRINSAADDPAGLTIATKLNSRSEGLKTALSNIGDAKNLLAVAESGLGRINDIIVQMRNKAEAAASDTMGSAERSAILEQMKAFAAQIDDIGSQTKWQDKSLINGSFYSTALTFQTGTDSLDFTSVSNLDNMAATGVSNGRDSLKLAAKSGTASVGIVGGDAQNLFEDATAPSAVAVANTNLAELGAGTYTVSVTKTTATQGTVHLYDAGGNELLIAQNIAGTGAVGKGLSVDLTADATFNFGNGLQVVLNSGAANGSTTTGQVTYAPGSSYSISTNGDTGTALSGASTAADFRSYMTYLDGKLDIVSGQLSKIGALTGRLTFKEDQVSASQINVEASYNRIMNANMAEEQVNASKYVILQQTATAMLAQANSAPQFLLSLFR